MRGLCRVGSGEWGEEGAVCGLARDAAGPATCSEAAWLATAVLALQVGGQ